MTAPRVPPTVKEYGSISELSAGLGAYVAEVSKAAIAARGQFIVAVSGGSLPAILGEALVGHDAGIEWSKWHVFLADERLVANTHEDSNYKQVGQALTWRVPIAAAQVHAIDDTLLDDAAGVARDYTAQLEAVFGAASLPAFDLLLLGMGPDGHTCSLFPGHALVDSLAAPVAVVLDSPKPPARRITLTLPVLNAAHNVAFVSTGEQKAQVLHNILQNNDQSYPAARVSPASSVVWFLDVPAASLLPILAPSL
ncbi:6-phosphogluconolactonase [Physocladia obscura]|uniref:6-phosphogluconolactonase n=1 Tax=Physocladia obscura TaxID=109957 RepID=A0AAD5T1C6_9FUNG|nr:6-phosphogluconolactonase [Physocladia obscura]